MPFLVSVHDRGKLMGMRNFFEWMGLIGSEEYIMETINAVKWDDKALVLAKATDIAKVYDLVEKEENFILTWFEGEVRKSKLVMANDWASKVKTGDIELTAQE